MRRRRSCWLDRFPKARLQQLYQSYCANPRQSPRGLYLQYGLRRFCSEGTFRNSVRHWRQQSRALLAFPHGGNSCPGRIRWPCRVCGGATRYGNRYQICGRHRACRLAYQAHYRADRRRGVAPIPAKCRICGAPVRNPILRICATTLLCAVVQGRIRRVFYADGPLRRHKDYCPQEPHSSFVRAIFEQIRSELAERRRLASNRRKRLKSRANGILPKARGQRAPNWRGGRYCYCARCGVPLGWKRPCQAGQSRRYCRTCSRLGVSDVTHAI